MATKQAIVMRLKYPDGKGGFKGLRAGKQIAQGSHASQAFLSRQVQSHPESETGVYSIKVSSAQKQWVDSSFTKIVFCVNTEEELMAIAGKAKELGVEFHIVTDSGKTEFDGVATVTCLALGPDFVENVDPITKDLRLY